MIDPIADNVPFRQHFALHIELRITKMQTIFPCSARTTTIDVLRERGQGGQGGQGGPAVRRAFDVCQKIELVSRLAFSSFEC